MLLALLGRMDWATFKILVIGGVGFLTLYVLVQYLWDRWQRHRTRNWVVTTATVTSVDWDRMSGTKGNSSTAYTRLTVNYTYVGATEHTARYTFNKDSHTAAVELANSLAGTTFNVRYDPQDEGRPVVLMADRAG